MKFNNYKEFEINLLTDKLIQRFSPYERKKLLELMKTTIDFGKDDQWLYNLILEHKDLPYSKFKIKFDKGLKA